MSVCMCVCLLNHIWLFVTPWTIACQDPLSMEFSRQEYWSGLPLSTPGDLPDTGIIPVSFASPTLSGRFFITVPPVKPIVSQTHQKHVFKKNIIRFFFFENSYTTSICQYRRGRSCGMDPWVRKILWGRKWQSTPVFLPGKPHGQRSLVGSQRIKHYWATEHARTT